MTFKIPQNIEKEAKAYMKDVIAKLTENGLIETVDTAALRMLAYNYDTFIKANKVIEREGLTIKSDRGNIAEHPCVKIAKDAQTQAMKVMVEFGLTAKSRGKLAAPKDDDENDPFVDYIKRKGEE